MILATSLQDEDPNVVFTATELAKEYGALLNTTQMADLLGVSLETMTQNISRETVPFPITKIGRKWYASSYDVARYVIEKQIKF